MRSFVENKKFAKDLEARTKKFAIRIIKLAALLPNSPEGSNVRYQLTRSGSSIGANYREANRAVSSLQSSRQSDKVVGRETVHEVI